MKIKSFEYPKFVRNYGKKILGKSDSWLMSHLSHQPSKPAYYIVDCQISSLPPLKVQLANLGRFAPEFDANLVTEDC